MKKFLSLLMMVTMTVAMHAAQVWLATNPSELRTGDVVVIVETTGKHALPNNGGYTFTPEAVAVTLSDDKSKLTSTVTDALKWTLTVNNGTYKFKIGKSDVGLYCTNSNDGVRVDYSLQDEFTIVNGYLCNTATNRYLGVYNNQKWHCYTYYTNSNIAGQQFAFYKLTDDAIVAKPEITLSPAKGPYYQGSNVDVHITCATPGASIQYQTDNISYWINGNTLTLNSTTTLRARATLNDVNSEEIEKTVTFVPEGGSGGNIDDLTNDLIWATPGVYGAWTATGASGTEYAGNTAGSYNAIEMNDNNHFSGIVSTKSVGKIKKVTLTWNSNTAPSHPVNIYGSNIAYTSPADLYDSSKQGTMIGSLNISNTAQTIDVTGDYDYIGIRAGNGIMFLNSIKVEWEPSTGTVAAPVITLDPAEGPYYEGSTVNVNISCATDGAWIYYSRDNGATWTLGNQLTVTESSTINAKAVLLDQQSTIVSKSITFVPKTNTVNSIAEFNALEEGTRCVFSGLVKVIAQVSDRLYVQDESRGMMMYGSLGRTYQRGDVLPTGFSGQRSSEHGAPRMSAVSGVEAAAENVTLVPVEITPSQVTLDNVFCYTVIKGATVSGGNIIVGNQSVKINNRFEIDIPDDNEAHDVVGIIDYYDGPQFMPLEFKDITFPKYTITIVPSEHGTLTANFTEAEAGETIILTATPDAGYELDVITYVYDPNPSGAFFTVENNQFMMPGINVRVFATFKLKEYKVVINQVANDHGTVTADKAIAHSGDVVTVTATAQPGYRLNSLYFTYQKDGAPYSENIDMTTGRFTMPAADVNVAHEFVAIDYNVYVDDAIQHGSISVDKTTAHVGDVITVTTTPHEGYELETLEYVFDAGSIGDVHNSIDNGQFTMPAINVFVTGSFVGKMFNIVTSVYPEGKGTITVAPQARFNTEVEVSTTPAEGYRLKEMYYTYYAGGSGADPKFTIENGHFTMPLTNVTVFAEFEEIPAEYYPVSFATFENGAITSSVAQATIGETVTLTVAPSEGYELASISVLAGYYGSASQGAVNLLDENNWITIGEMEVTKVDDTHYSFVVPEGLNYTGNTQFKVLATFSKLTGILGINVDQISGNARFISPMGHVNTTPFRGVNIVVDGDKTYKIIVK